MRKTYLGREAASLKRDELCSVIYRIICMILVLIPLASFLINIVSWLSYGIDLPFLDDMRQYETGSAGRIDFDYISQPANDTYYSVGLFLDGLAFRFLDGNSVAYQAISLFCIVGGILYLQWKLLTRCVQSHALRAIAFSTTLLMLQPDSYWGWQNMAYHQAIPLVCSLGILSLAISDFNRWVAGGSIVILAFISGFSYTSGAFANLSLLIGFILFVALSKDNLTHRIKLCAGLLLLPTAITVFAQLWVIVAIQHGTHRPDASMAYPWESDFWYFMFGKVARSLMLPSEQPEISMTGSIAVMVLATALAGIALFKLIADRESNKDIKPAFVYLCLYGVSFLYLMIVSAGRTNLRPDFVQAPIDIFIYGYGRFHFFWITILWPWLVVFASLRFSFRLHAGASRLLASSASLAVVVFMILYTPIASHADFYKKTMAVRESIFKCIQDGLDAGSSFECSDLHPAMNMLKVFYMSKEAGASYTRLINARPVPLGTNKPAPIFRMTSRIDLIDFKNSSIAASDASGVSIVSKNDPMLIMSLEHDTLLSNCTELEVNGAYDIDHQDLAQIFYLPTGVNSFSEGFSGGIPLHAGGGTFSFSARSPTGFSSLLRFDPAIGATNVRIMEFEVRCKMDRRIGTKMR
ncbi:hypothetical protein J2X84_002365 [Pseudomonas corrugata]|uniref:hypothetical protein n=1 Tax=Pseudomonas corrugata TaxID=47879 RepID=UPI002854DED1|nr:hypothetical protein [Pseudomonas corrugata]MDR7283541.1 hypothetical protein [Pseudomonas corrugata]